MDHPDQGANNANTVPILNPNDPNGAVLGINQNLINNMDPNIMTGMMVPGQSFIPDPSLVGTMPDPSMMMPLMFGNANTAIPPPAVNKTITKDEIALYDRQIRLWGMAAQAKIQSANILLITIRALANEVAKNLVLAGVGSLTILDGAIVKECDLGAQFLLAEVENAVGQNRAEAASAALRKLNPRVQIHVDSDGVKSKGPSYFSSFDVVIATDLDPDTYNLINTATRLNGKSFYAAGTHGLYGYIFSDLIEHDYVIKRDVANVATEIKQETRTRSVVSVKTDKDGPKTVESVTKRELYSTWFLASDAAVLPEEFTKSKRRLKAVSPALSCLRALWEFMQMEGDRLPRNRDDLKIFTQTATLKHKALSLPSETLTPEYLRSFLQNLGSEIAPTCAILGGQLAQDVINVLGQTQQPIQNMVIFDGNTMEAVMYSLHPEGTLGASQLSLGGGAAPIVPNASSLMFPPPLPGALDGSTMLPINSIQMPPPLGMFPSTFPPGPNGQGGLADLPIPNQQIIVPTSGPNDPEMIPHPASANPPPTVQAVATVPTTTAAATAPPPNASSSSEPPKSSNAEGPPTST